MPKPEIIPLDRIQSRILVFRSQRVLLDEDLAGIYGVPTKALNQAAKRNKDRFPADFRFQLNHEEVAILRSQFVTSSSGHGGHRDQPFVFTEHGALMAATVLSSSPPRRVRNTTARLDSTPEPVNCRTELVCYADATRPRGEKVS